MIPAPVSGEKSGRSRANIEVDMSLDRSLKSASSLVRHRNVLTRAERLDVLKEQEKWDESKPVFGLPKVAHRKLEVGKAVKEEATEGEAATGATPAPGAAKGAAPAAGAKAAAPAAKGAAPAAKTPAAAPAKKGK
jgi:small basic protein (TIGR04137 family)